jgi:Fe2+ transport system protein FeoA
LGGHNVVDELTALSARPTGWHGVVQALRGGHDFRSRVANLGFTAGVPISVVQNMGRGPMLVSIRGTLVALGRAEAGKVLVGEGQ